MSYYRLNGNFVKVLEGNCRISSPQKAIKSLSELTGKDCFVQVVPSGVVLSKKHVLFALSFCMKLFESGSSRLKKPELEFLLAICARTQLEKALTFTGLKKGENDCFIVVFSQDKSLLEKKAIAAKKILSFSQKKVKLPSQKKIMEIFGISEKELKTCAGEKNALEKLVFEKTALAFLR